MKQLIVCFLLMLACSAYSQDHGRGNVLILPLGDSITEGSGGGGNAPSYRKALAESLTREGWNPLFVGARKFKSDNIANPNCRWHTGLSGQRVQSQKNLGGYLQGSAQWLDQAGYPDIITLMIGTNDLLQENPDGLKTFQHWKALVKDITEVRPQSWLIVSPVTPVLYNARGAEAALQYQRYNASIRSLFTVRKLTLFVDGESVRCVLGTLNAKGIEAFGANARVRFADMDAAMGVATPEHYYNNGADKVHPSQAGYNRMAAVWHAAIIELLNPLTGGTSLPVEMLTAYCPEGDLSRVAVVFNHEQHLNVKEITVNGSAPKSIKTSDGRLTVLTLATPLTAGTSVTVALPQTEIAPKTFVAQTTGAAARLPEMVEGWTKIATRILSDNDAFRKEQPFFSLPKESEQPAQVAYYLELARPDGDIRYIWVAMDRFPGWDQLAELPQRHFLSNMTVKSNVPHIESVTKATGVFQYTAGTIATAAVNADFPREVGGFDWNDTLNAPESNRRYGAFQFYRTYPKGHPRSGLDASVLFAYNRWAVSINGNDSDEVVIGDFANHCGFNGEWRGNGGKNALNAIFTYDYPNFSTRAYAVRRLEFWIRPANKWFFFF
ncbi:MAG: GDSL-type esterase/lipase family protein [Kiritimatiellia bacterium]